MRSVGCRGCVSKKRHAPDARRCEVRCYWRAERLTPARVAEGPFQHTCPDWPAAHDHGCRCTSGAGRRRRPSTLDSAHISPVPRCGTRLGCWQYLITRLLLRACTSPMQAMAFTPALAMRSSALERTKQRSVGPVEKRKIRRRRSVVVASQQIASGHDRLPSRRRAPRSASRLRG
jgi:hypothetical protein